uniref:Uncharacterized protein n=1 Tax=Pavo cristatus TaxID=9049 RepID=A0A8C9EJU5_PAVCR
VGRAHQSLQDLVHGGRAAANRPGPRRGPPPSSPPPPPRGPPVAPARYAALTAATAAAPAALPPALARAAAAPQPLRYRRDPNGDGRAFPDDPETELHKQEARSRASARRQPPCRGTGQWGASGGGGRWHGAGNVV